jgi:hypothetical protein
MTAAKTLPNRATAEDLGAPYENYDEIEDPETDLDVDDYNTLVANVSGLIQTGALVVMTAADDGIINACDSVWGSDASVWPAATSVGPGHYSYEWDASLATLHPTDTTAQAVSFRFAQAQAVGSTPLMASTVITGTTIDVYFLDQAGNPQDTGFSLVVW